MQSPGSHSAEAFARHVLRVIIALVPWGLSLFLHFWLEHSGTWDVQMGGRALVSVLLLAIGMTMSFFLYGRLSSLTQRAAKPTPDSSSSSS